MDRRDFIKKTAMTVAGTAVTAPVMDKSFFFVMS